MSRDRAFYTWTKIRFHSIDLNQMIKRLLKTFVDKKSLFQSFFFALFTFALPLLFNYEKKNIRQICDDELQYIMYLSKTTINFYFIHRFWHNLVDDKIFENFNDLQKVKISMIIDETNEKMNANNTESMNLK